MEEVKIVEMDEMLVASFHAIGESPEIAAITKMQDWAKPKGLIDDEGKYPVFGFDNPCPGPDDKEYGYEVWVKLDGEVEDDNVTVKRIPATKYAMLYSPGFENIGPNWRKLMEWVKNSDEYEHAPGQCLEGQVPGSTEEGDFALYLYEPVRKK
jgi:effector-binding domain-containing protein